MIRLESLLKTVCCCCRLKGANKACQTGASVEKKKSVNVMSASGEGEKLLFNIQELKELALCFCT